MVSDLLLNGLSCYTRRQVPVTTIANFSSQVSCYTRRQVPVTTVEIVSSQLSCYTRRQVPVTTVANVSSQLSCYTRRQVPVTTVANVSSQLVSVYEVTQHSFVVALRLAVSCWVVGGGPRLLDTIMITGPAQRQPQTSGLGQNGVGEGLHLD